MRQTLSDLLRQVVGFSFTLPKGTQIPKVQLSTEPDECLSIQTTDDDLAKVIYNGIVEYSFDNLDSYLGRLNDAQIIALKSKLKFNPTATQDARLKYGFYGEVLLFLFLQHFHNADTVVSRGWFYLPTENAETKGYDTYQMVERGDGSIELWFGEVKFYQNYKDAVKKILNKVSTSLSDDYLETNILTISQQPKEINPRSKIDRIINDWQDDPRRIIIDEVVKHNMTLVYPMLVLFEDKDMSYDDIIKEVVEFINTEFPTISYTIKVPTKLFFMLLPVNSAKAIKSQVLTWIDTKVPLI